MRPESATATPPVPPIATEIYRGHAKRTIHVTVVAEQAAAVGGVFRPAPIEAITVPVQPVTTAQATATLLQVCALHTTTQERTIRPALTTGPKWEAMPTGTWKNAVLWSPSTEVMAL